ncbi:MAG TPA: SDR family NAD(P)-dependent oxidoreductase [Candidatus Binatia bacterium]|jgi:NADP-dependent 3-hydroxy acid dehydrogenase YdfG|nr:SDR family NAD(P)-dependent oxidoreductase [Candidatus Binatia bacterium]
MESLVGRRAVVTGASSGIGAATVRALAAAGASVVAAARRRERLEALATDLAARGAEVVVQPTDMRREEDVLRLFAVARERLGGVDVLVNNAGLGRAAPLSSAPTELWREMLEVNVLGLCIATREAIQDMERRGSAGHVVHVSSMAGHRIPGPESGVYAATKFAVRALTEALRQELRARQSPIRVTAISPGHVLTEFADVFTGTPGAARALDGRFKVLEADDVAEAILWVLRRPPYVEVHDLLVRPTAQRN